MTTVQTAPSGPGLRPDDLASRSPRPAVPVERIVITWEVDRLLAWANPA